jgi:hypothetical protein
MDAGEKDSAGDFFALHADRIEVGGAVFLRADNSNNCTIRGSVIFVSARVRSNFQLLGELKKPADEQTTYSVDFQHARLEGGLWLELAGHEFQPNGAHVFLSGAHASTLRDSIQAWGNNYTIDGFTYDALDPESPQSAQERAPWLAKQQLRNANFPAQPYRQLARVLAAQGRERDARDILIQLEREHHTWDNPSRAWKQGWNNLSGNTSLQKCSDPRGGELLTRTFFIALKHASRFPLRWFTAYGYKPWRAVGWMVLLWALGLFVVEMGRSNFSPAQGDVLSSWADRPKTAHRLADEYPKLSPAIFSLDAMLPLVNLHQEDYWLPDAGKGNTCLRVPLYFGKITSGRFLRWWHWAHIAMGYTLSTLAAVGFLGVMTRSRDEEKNS